MFMLGTKSSLWELFVLWWNGPGQSNLVSRLGDTSQSLTLPNLCPVGSALPPAHRTQGALLGKPEGSSPILALGMSRICWNSLEVHTGVQKQTRLAGRLVRGD